MMSRYAIITPGIVVVCREQIPGRFCDNSLEEEVPTEAALSNGDSTAKLVCERILDSMPQARRGQVCASSSTDYLH